MRQPRNPFRRVTPLEPSRMCDPARAVKFRDDMRFGLAGDDLGFLEIKDLHVRELGPKQHSRQVVIAAAVLACPNHQNNPPSIQRTRF